MSIFLFVERGKVVFTGKLYDFADGFANDISAYFTVFSVHILGAERGCGMFGDRPCLTWLTNVIANEIDYGSWRGNISPTLYKAIIVWYRSGPFGMLRSYKSLHR